MFYSLSNDLADKRGIKKSSNYRAMFRKLSWTRPSFLHIQIPSKLQIEAQPWKYMPPTYYMSQY